MGRNSKFVMLGMVLITSFLIVSCDPSKKLEKQEKENIDDFLRLNNISVTPTSTGLYYIEELEGMGNTPQVNDTVSVYYTGMLLTGNIFDSNLTSEPYSFIMGSYSVLKGFEEGISYMKEGGKATLLLPSSLAYGAFGFYDYYHSIPGYSPLVFTVELLNVKPGIGK